ncbi:MAG: Hsp20/alpha crystallin family protein [Candidatus Asgardarchaeia archaeon]
MSDIEKIRKRIKELLNEMFKEFEREFSEIDEEIELMTRSSFEDINLGEKPMWDYHDTHLEATCEVHDTEEKMMIIIDLPYVEKKEDIEIAIEGNKLTVDAKFREPIKFRGWAGRLGDTAFTHITKTIPLPENIEKDGIKAKFKNGVLIIEIPKKLKKVRINVE